MAKKFKLVYDQKGTLKGSYTGIPGDKDPVLIERAILEGEKAPDPKPAGEKKIIKNGKYDVSKFATADVKVEGGIVPSGQLEIVENGKYNVFDKADVNVDVPQGVFPKGSLEITKNGEYDVTEKASVKVDVKEPEPEPIDNDRSLEEARALIFTLEEAWVDGHIREMKVDKTFKFENANFDYIRDIIFSIDTEFFKDILIYLEDGAMQLDLNISMSLSAYRSTENSFTYFSLYWDDQTPSYNPDCSVVEETDAETGDSKIVATFPDEPFTGSLRIALDGSKIISEL